MTSPPYDVDALKTFVSTALQEAPRGTKARLVERAGVTAPTVTKWAKGETCPSPDYWSAIEKELGFPFGRLGEVAGFGLLPHYREDAGERERVTTFTEGDRRMLAAERERGHNAAERLDKIQDSLERLVEEGAEDRQLLHELADRVAQLEAERPGRHLRVAADSDQPGAEPMDRGVTVARPQPPAEDGEHTDG